MPTYEYACKGCGQHLEVVQSFKDSALTECPACGGSLRKVFGNIGITFKGSGFYKTDSRSDKRKGAEKDGQKEKAGDGAKTSEGGSAASGSGSASAGGTGGAEAAKSPGTGSAPKVESAPKPKAAAAAGSGS